MSQLVALHLQSELFANPRSPVKESYTPWPSRGLHKAFLALLAVNVFVVSAMTCFGLLYFFQ